MKIPNKKNSIIQSNILPSIQKIDLKKEEDMIIREAFKISAKSIFETALDKLHNQKLIDNDFFYDEKSLRIAIQKGKLSAQKETAEKVQKLKTLSFRFFGDELAYEQFMKELDKIFKEASQEQEKKV